MPAAPRLLEGTKSDSTGGDGVKLQRRGVLGFLPDSLTVHRRRRPTLSLLPTETGQLVSAA